MSDDIPARIPQQQVPPGWYPDPSMGNRQRWWDGYQWAAVAPPMQRQGNAYAIAALILGICGFFGMGIPLFIGWFIGGPLDLLAIIFGIIGLVVSGSRGGAGVGASVTALILAGISLVSVFFGAGSIW